MELSLRKYMIESVCSPILHKGKMGRESVSVPHPDHSHTFLFFGPLPTPPTALCEVF